MGSSKTATEVTDDSSTETDTDSVSATSANSSRTLLTMNSTTIPPMTSLPPSIPLVMPKERRYSLNIIFEFIKLRYCKSITSRKNGNSMFIIFWDEWLGVDRLMKLMEEICRKNVFLMRLMSMTRIKKLTVPHRLNQKVLLVTCVLNETHVNDKNAKADRASQIKSKSFTGNSYHSFWQACQHSGSPSFKKQLVDDCEFVTHLGKKLNAKQNLLRRFLFHVLFPRLVKLPRTPNVIDIFNKYLDFILKKDGSVPDSVDEIFKRLGSYFDKALPVILLYKKERHRYQEARLDDIAPSTVYGAEHLLSLFGSSFLSARPAFHE